MTEHDNKVLHADGPIFFGAHRNLAGVDVGRILTSKRLCIRGQDKQPKYIVTVIEDVTERHELEKERDRNRDFLDQIIENVPSVIYVKNASDRRYVLWNRAAERFWGKSRADVLGKTCYDVFSKEEAERLTLRDDQLLQRKEPVFDERQVRPASGDERTIFSRRLPIQDNQGNPQYLLGVVEDVTERKNAEQRIAHLAHFDALTNLPNRVLLREKLEQELSLVRRGGQLAVLYLDLDHFKSVNDTLGHSAGDELLKAVTERMRGCLHEADILARLGGDEFAIVQTGIEHPTDAAVLAQKLRDAVNQTSYDLHGHQVVVDISIGIALAPDDGTEVDELLKCADMALYGAKSEGRGTYRYFEAEMDARMKMRRSLEVDLRKALINNEFELHYQPLVRLADNQISGCEALLRWYHPRRGLISPADFIPVAEETGLINAIGEWVLRQACAEAATWPNDLKVAVNVSPVQFRSQGLPQAVINALGDGEPGAAPAGAGDHGIGAVAEQRNDAAPAASAARARRAHLDGRFRHRLLVAELPAQLPVRQDQDRSIVHQRSLERQRRGRDRAGDHHARQQPQDDHHGGRRRDRAAGAGAARDGLRRDAGLSVQSAETGPGNQGSTRRASDARRTEARRTRSARQAGRERSLADAAFGTPAMMQAPRAEPTGTSRASLRHASGSESRE